MNYSHDEFIRTTEKRHAKLIGSMDGVAENGHIYLDTYSGWYAVRDEAFYAEDEH